MKHYYFPSAAEASWYQAPVSWHEFEKTCNNENVAYPTVALKYPNAASKNPEFG
jgi:hypothetical protein